MTDKPVRRDPQVEAANEIYKAARAGVEIEIAKRDDIIAGLKEEKEGLIAQAKAMGILEKIRLDRSYNDFIEAMTLYQIKEMKAYKEGGFNWEKFCEAVKMNWRTADRIIEDIRPLYDLYSDNVSTFSGIPLNKIRYLGKALSDTVTDFVTEEGILIGDERVPVLPENSDVIAAHFDHLVEQIGALKEEQGAQKKAFERVQEETHKSLVKAEKEIARLKKSLAVSDLLPEDQDLIDLMAKVQTDLIAGIQAIKGAMPAALTPLVCQRAYYFLLIFLQKLGMEEREALHEQYQDAEETPWEILEEDLPSPETLVAETPATRQFGKAYAARTAARNAKTAKGTKDE